MVLYDTMLTTFDNPYDPFEQFTSWYLFDVEKGYNCCSRIARIAKCTDDMTQREVNAEIERAIDVILKHDFMNIFKKIKKESEEIPEEDENEDDSGA